MELCVPTLTARVAKGPVVVRPLNDNPYTMVVD